MCIVQSVRQVFRSSAEMASAQSTTSSLIAAKVMRPTLRPPVVSRSRKNSPRPSTIVPAYGVPNRGARVSIQWMNHLPSRGSNARTLSPSIASGSPMPSQKNETRPCQRSISAQPSRAAATDVRAGSSSQVPSWRRMR